MGCLQQDKIQGDVCNMDRNSMRMFVMGCL